MAFADFVQTEEKIISESVKEDLNTIKSETEKNLKNITDTVASISSATAAGIISGMSDTEEQIDNIIENVDFGNQLANKISKTPTVIFPNIKQIEDASTTDTQEQHLQTTQLTDIAQNTSILDTVDQLNSSMDSIDGSLTTISDELVSNSDITDQINESMVSSSDSLSTISNEITGSTNVTEQIADSLENIDGSVSTMTDEMTDNTFAEEIERERKVREEEELAELKKQTEALEEANKIDNPSTGGIIKALLAVGAALVAGFVFNWDDGVKSAFKAGGLKTLAKAEKSRAILQASQLRKGLKEVDGKHWLHPIRLMKGFLKTVWMPFGFVLEKLGVDVEKFIKQTKNSGAQLVGNLSHHQDLIDQHIRTANKAAGFTDDAVVATSRLGKITQGITAGWKKFWSILTIPFKAIWKAISGIEKVASSIAGIAKIITKLKGLGKLLGWVGLIIMVIDSVQLTIGGIMKGWKEGGILGAIKGGFSGLFQATIGDLVNLLYDGIGIIFKGLGHLFGIESFKKIGDEIMSMDIIAIFKEMFSLIGTAITDGISSIIEFDWGGATKSIITDIWDSFMHSFRALNDWIKEKLGIPTWDNIWPTDLLGTLGEAIKKMVLFFIPNWFGLKSKAAKALGISIPTKVETDPDLRSRVTPDGFTESWFDTPTDWSNRITPEGFTESWIPTPSIDRGKDLNEESNNNNDSKLSMNFLSSNHITSVAPVTITQGTSSYHIPDGGTDPNNAAVRAGISSAYRR